MSPRNAGDALCLRLDWAVRLAVHLSTSGEAFLPSADVLSPGIKVPLRS